MTRLYKSRIVILVGRKKDKETGEMKMTKKLGRLVVRRMDEADKAKATMKEIGDGLKNVRVSFTPTQLKRMGL